MRDGFAVATHRVYRAIKDLGLPWVFVGQCPVPVGLGTAVSTFRAQHLVVDIGEVAVPREEDTLLLLVSRQERRLLTVN